MSVPTIFGKSQSDVLADIGTALLQIKNSRGLTAEDMRVIFGLKADDMVPRYIAGESEMGVMAWLRANEAWPELTERIEDTAAERAMRARQRALDLEMPLRRERSA